MNPNYNHHQQPYQYQQHSTGPVQPPWQQDPNHRPGWQDPRYNNHPISPPPPLPQQIPPTSYQPVSYGPISGQPLPPPPSQPAQYVSPNHPGPYGPPPSQHTSPPQQQHAYDTASWGVRYNQAQQQIPQQQPHLHHGHQSQDIRPTLPPRPSSKPLPEEKPVSNWNRPSLVPLPDGTWQFPQYIAEQKAPTPPPRPPSHITQAHLPPSIQHQTQRPTGQSWNSTSSYTNSQPPHLQTPGGPYPPWNTTSHHSEGTVSPIDDDRRSFTMTGRSENISSTGRSDTASPPLGHRKQTSKQSTSSVSHFQGAPIGANALGPSDWQVYTSEPAEDEDLRGQNNPTPTEQSKPVQTVVTTSQPVGATPAIASDGPSFAPPTVPQQSIIVQTPPPKPHYADTHTSSPEPVHSKVMPAQIQRAQSEETQSTSSEPIRSGTIDSLIQAWNAPLQTGFTANGVSQTIVPSGAENTLKREADMRGIDQSSQTDFCPELKTETRIETRVETREVQVDPYADIQNVYAATLKRFAGMLRQEAAAESDEEKYKIFQTFVMRELRLRSVLYGTDVPPAEPPRSTETSVAQPQTRSLETAPTHPETAQLEPTPAVTVTEPVSTVNNDIPPSIQEPQAKDIIVPSQPTSAAPPPEIESNAETSNNMSRPQTPPKIAPLTIPQQASPQHAAPTEPKAEDVEGEYSPGGRPRITPARQQTNPAKIPPAVIVTTAVPQAKEMNPSPGANAPMTLDDYVMPDQPASPLYEAPIVVTDEDLLRRQYDAPPLATTPQPLNFHPPRPTYTPFRQGDRSVSPLPDIRVRSPDESYNSMRQSQAAESGRLLSNEVASPVTNTPSRNHNRTPSQGREEHEEAFIGLIRRESKAIRKRPSNMLEQLTQLRAGTPMAPRNNTPTPTPAVISPLTQAMRSLRHIIPKTLLSEASANPKLEPITTGLSKLPDEFGFINTTVVTWDQSNRAIRTRLEQERSDRETANQTRVNELYEDDEIGYADIGALEAEFKLNEAEKKYQEEKLELESFVKEVFDKVTTRLESELGALVKLRLMTADLLESSSASAGTRFQLVAEGKNNHGKVPMTELMDLILQLHAKIELRHQKIAEAQFERERRRKRLEMSVLNTNRDTPAMKKLDQEFLEAQLRLVVEEARKKDERANKLMDAFDRAVVRGLAENQAWIDEAQSRLLLVRDLIMGSSEHMPTDDQERDTLLYGADGVREIMLQTQSALDLVLSDSHSIVRLANVVDMVLNEADYAMYHAEERMAKSLPEKFEKLKQDKAKEDEKIRDDFATRMSGIDKGPQDLVGLIRDINGKVGVDGGHGARLGKALEEAKRRNERHRGDSVSSPILGGNTTGTF